MQYRYGYVVTACCVVLRVVYNTVLILCYWLPGYYYIRRVSFCPRMSEREQNSVRARRWVLGAGGKAREHRRIPGGAKKIEIGVAALGSRAMRGA